MSCQDLIYSQRLILRLNPLQRELKQTLQPLQVFLSTRNLMNLLLGSKLKSCDSQSGRSRMHHHQMVNPPDKLTCFVCCFETIMK